MRGPGIVAIMLSWVCMLQAQSHNCPQGFDYAGALRGSSSYGVDFNERREVTLPLYATIDTSFQQANVRVRGGNDRAKSDMRAKDIPKGILIITHGSTDYGSGWAVSAPELKEVGTPPRYRFGVKLFCTSSSTAPEMHYGGCDVSVEVCYKAKR